MNDEILKECQQAKERLAVLFGDVDSLMDFLKKRREQRIKQGRNILIFLLIARRCKKNLSPN